MMKGIIFDCDGVLFDTAKANEIYYNILRTTVGLPPLTEEEARFAHSATVHQVFEELTPADKKTAIMEVAKNIPYLETALPHIEMDKDLKTLLDFLQKNNKKIGIFTNRTRAGVIDILEHFGIREYFSDIITCDEVAPKPAPEGLYLLEQRWGIPLENLFFVGDSMADYGAGKCTSVQLIIFKNTTIPAIRHVESFSEIIPLLQGASA